MNFDKLSLKQLRVMNGYTQAQIANALRMHVTTYRRIEQHPETATVKEGKALANLYGVDFNQIIFDGTTNLICKGGEE